MQENQTMAKKTNEAHRFYMGLPLAVRQRIREAYIAKFELADTYFYTRLRSGRFSEMEFDFIKQEAKNFMEN